ncbi:hypothetical protein HBI56_032950 [Parastagonospora nodorum]|uniref:Uncharacterized protein n=1 Tax=Phaeosphaeria nodorum (strain SN15 / ATCC MYA-4574 / FGSC 10173) TaxID=321614 RepID=A0A7U2F0S8_PHANO|nr:hypothetical protein HBH56_020750 [Parastagonospora nodorum]QRC95448.1 hypothetical protein JI435_302340 [Parastagonospora nodorum SN15]KAH3937005.1 hypothetical protein HBH54_013750 [Parastagonospora nodorum]KAH3943981.1 hypothetical protein HBH53_163000 [Parastagonospora nodorum]KAH3967549.1 hypothetical protein HBH51_137480 [Parastagonospora nodorum]
MWCCQEPHAATSASACSTNLVSSAKSFGLCFHHGHQQVQPRIFRQTSKVRCDMSMSAKRCVYFFHPVWRLQQFFESPGSACIRLDQHRCPAAGAGAELNPLGWFNQSGRASSTWGMRWGKEPIDHGCTGSDTPVTP